MRTVSIEELKNDLSRYVRLASEGEMVLISDGDRIVAELVPLQATRAGEVPDALLAEMVRRGVVTPAMIRPGGRPKVPAPSARVTDVLAELDEDRSER